MTSSHPGPFRFPVSGLTHLETDAGTSADQHSKNTPPGTNSNQSTARGGRGGSGGDEVRWSAYRFHEQDPVLFHGGIRFMWRIGDYDNRVDPAKRWSPKCYIDQPGPGDTVVLHPTASTVTSYAWVYTW